MATEIYQVGFIGYGNMAQAMAEGLISTGTLKAQQICCCARDWEKLQRNAEKLGVMPLPAASKVAEASEIVILAVKPHQLKEVLAPLQETLRSKVVVSVAADVPFTKLDELLAPGTHHISTLPNTPIAIGKGVLLCESVSSLTPDEDKKLTELFSGTALVRKVEPSQMGIAGTIAGCGPAFVSMFLEALGDAGVQHGLTRDLAYQLAGQMVTGTGALLTESGRHPGQLKDAVCSPGGTTIVGVAALERRGFRSAVIDAIDAIENK